MYIAEQASLILLFFRETALWFSFPLLLFFFCLFRATPTAYEGSQARRPIGAVAAGLHYGHSKPDPSHICHLHLSSQQQWILNPLRKARDQTCILIDASQICFPSSHNGSSQQPLLKSQYPLYSHNWREWFEAIGSFKTYHSESLPRSTSKSEMRLASLGSKSHH